MRLRDEKFIAFSLAAHTENPQNPHMIILIQPYKLDIFQFKLYYVKMDYI